jgi:hypothetical protein
MAGSEQQSNRTRRVGRPFAPGVSGNPGGRPRGLVAAIRQATEDGGELVAFMVRVFRGQEPKATLRDRVAAATWLADRCFGRPPQAVSVALDSGQEARELQEARVRALLERLPSETVRQLHAALLTVRDATLAPTKADF